jgi:hypothetical protein
MMSNNHHHYYHLLATIAVLGALFSSILITTAYAQPQTHGRNGQGDNNNENIPAGCPDDTIDFDQDTQMCILPTDLLCDEANGFVLDEENEICVNPETEETTPPNAECREGSEEIGEGNFCQISPGSGSGDTNRNTPGTPPTGGRVSEFDEDTGTGFIPIGQIQGAFELSQSELRKLADTGDPFRIEVIAQIVLRVECSEGVRFFEEERQAAVNYEFATNSQGQITGIELKGYEDETDPFDLDTINDVCDGSLVGSYETVEFETTGIRISGSGQQATISI